MPEITSFNEGYLSGADGIRLYCTDIGNPDKPAVLFIHGWSQTHGAWSNQFNSKLPEEFHLIAFDLRGHGYSECPVGEEYYLNSKLYADDLHAVISHYKKKALVLVGWSSGALVIGDYLRRYGQDNITGIIMVSGLHGLGIEKLTGMLGTGPGEYMADTMNNDFQTQYNAMLRCIGDMVVEIGPEQLQSMTAQSMMTSPAVRAAMMARVVDNTDVSTEFSNPVLIIHGRHDPFILVNAAEHLHELFSHSTLSIYEKSAHMPFWEDPEKFNRELVEFAKKITENTT